MKEKCFSSFINLINMPWPRVKFFFHWPTTITKLWSREKKLLFSFSYYDHYAMIKREKRFFHSATFSTNKEGKMLFFIFSLRSLCHDQEWKFFFDLATTNTTLWSREKKVFFFIYLLRSIRHVQKRKKFFSFSHLVH